MKKLGPLNSFKKTKKFIYGLTDLEISVNEVTFQILIDPVNSGKKSTRNGSKTSDPKEVRFLAGVKYDKGSYAIKRGLKTKTETKNVLEDLMLKLDAETSKDGKKSILIKASI
jgi:hypothetical protein